MGEKELQGRPAPPDADKWLDYITRLKQEAPTRYEDAAKFLVTIISLTITIIFASVDKLKLIVLHPLFLFLILFLWLCALFCAFMVLFPHRYSVSSKEIKKIKNTVEIITAKKKRYFILAVWLYFLPLGLLLLLYLLFIINSMTYHGEFV